MDKNSRIIQDTSQLGKDDVSNAHIIEDNIRCQDEDITDLKSIMSLKELLRNKDFEAEIFDAASKLPPPNPNGVHIIGKLK